MSGALAERMPRISNATLKVTEWNGEVVFLHEVVPGAGHAWEEVLDPANHTAHTVYRTERCRETLTVGESGCAAFKGFYGEYDAEVTANGRTTHHAIHLTKTPDANPTFTLTV